MTKESEFETIGRRSRKVCVGDVFSWKLRNREMCVGQVLHDSIEIGFGPLFLVAFFDVQAREDVTGLGDLNASRLVDPPFITNARGWLDGNFVRIESGRPSKLGSIGISVGYLGKVIDVNGAPVERKDCDLVIEGMLSPSGAIARRLSVILDYKEDPAGSEVPWERTRG